jgi:release factor glutamine methyltransferase
VITQMGETLPLMDSGDLVAQLRAAGCAFAEDEARLLQEAAADDDRLRVLAGRRVAGEPLEHVLGWAEFCGLRIQVDPGVFRPRPRTEFLVEHAAILVRADNSGAVVEGPGDTVVRPGASGAVVEGPDATEPRPGVWATVVVDLCCGSGALGVALATMLGRAEPPARDTDRGAGSLELHAADLDPVAVACARRNVEPLGGHVHLGDLFEALPADLRGRVDVLLANVPYVPTGDLGLMPAEARLHEPVGTLDGGQDGLEVLRRVAAEAPRWLAPGGHLLTEASSRQAEAAADVLSSAGLTPSVVTSEEHDATVVVGAAWT